MRLRDCKKAKISDKAIPHPTSSGAPFTQRSLDLSYEIRYAHRYEFAFANVMSSLCERYDMIAI